MKIHVWLFHDIVGLGNTTITRQPESWAGGRDPTGAARAFWGEEKPHGDVDRPEENIWRRMVKVQQCNKGVSMDMVWTHVFSVSQTTL